MDAFFEALTAGENKIPPEFDWFAPLLGDWDFTYTDGLGGGRTVQGEWLFRRALNGAGIQDLFICPSRATMVDDPQPDGEYGAAIRMFNAKTGCYDMAYCCEGHVRLLTFVKEGERLVGTPADDSAGKWVFSEIGEDAFHWQNFTVLEDGTWRANSDVYARRRPVR